MMIDKVLIFVEIFVNVRVRNIKIIRIGRVIVLKFMWFKNL